MTLINLNPCGPLMRTFRRLALAALCLLSLAAGTAAHAGPIAEFDGALADSWAHCRDALYQSDPAHTDDKAAIEAMTAFRRSWAKLSARWSASPPPHYSEDPDFTQDMTDIAEVAEDALRLAEEGDIGQARSTLLQVPALLSEMRRENSIDSFTDRLDAFSEKLAEITEDSFDRAELSPPQVVALIRQVSVLDYLGEQLEKRAPARVAEDENFLAMVEDINAQLRGLGIAVLAGQRAPVLAALSDLRRAFDRFYLLYG